MWDVLNTLPLGRQEFSSLPHSGLLGLQMAFLRVWLAHPTLIQGSRLIQAELQMFPDPKCAPSWPLAPSP